MNMDVDLYDHQLLECCQDEHHHRHDGGFLDSHHGSTGETMSRSIIDPVVSNIENDLMPKSARETTNPEVLFITRLIRLSWKMWLSLISFSFPVFLVKHVAPCLLLEI